MPPSETFRDSLRAGRLQDAFLLAMGQVVELKVTTWVAQETDITTATAGHRLQTRIDLVEGDIENEIGERFITKTDYQPLRQFHLAQVAQSQRMIRQNIQSLQRLFAVLADVNDSDRPTPSLTTANSALPEAVRSDPEVTTTAMEGNDRLTTDLSSELPLSESISAQTEGDPWPAPTDPFADLNLPSPTGSPAAPSSPPAQQSADWQFSDGQPGSVLPDSSGLEGVAPRPLSAPEEEEDWGEFVEFVEESSFEPETLSPEETLYNPFALPLDDPQPYTSVVQEDWAAIPPGETPEPPIEDLSQRLPDNNNSDDADVLSPENWDKDTLGEDFYPPPQP
ncbi:MAG: hypothetical protein F6J87_08440 [Spirulina sp. SIO3F2]|nr:hypothetical protein [Spirulina sp. SIO3F2]